MRKPVMPFLRDLARAGKAAADHGARTRRMMRSLSLGVPSWWSMRWELAMVATHALLSDDTLTGSLNLVAARVSEESLMRGL